MSETTDTTREAVERLAVLYDKTCGGLPCTADEQCDCRDTAATLRALLDQREALLSALARMQKAALRLREAETDDDFDRAGAEMCRANNTAEAVIAKIEGKRA